MLAVLVAAPVLLLHVPARAEGPQPPVPSPSPSVTSPAMPSSPSVPVPSPSLPVPSYLPTPPTVPSPNSVEPPPQVEDAGGLVPELAAAWERAVAVGAEQGVPLTLTSGYRSAAEQTVLFDEGLAQYGTVAETRKWVSAPWESAHVRGLAIDVGPPSSQAWLEAHQDEFGLCRRFTNETWHFELRRPEWATCPALVPTAADYLA